MQPVVWVKSLFESKGMGWHRSGENITYKLSKLCKWSHS